LIKDDIVSPKKDHQRLSQFKNIKLGHNIIIIISMALGTTTFAIPNKSHQITMLNHLIN